MARTASCSGFAWARQRAFTLLEMVITMVIAGLLLAAVAFFLRGPMQAYLDVANRGEMLDTADTALRRMDRDVRLALPNSVRVSSGTSSCVELIPTKTGGRYRAAVDSGGNGDILDFTTADTSFDMFGALPTDPAQIPAAGDRVVVYNLGPASPGSDAYTGSDSNVIASTSYNAVRQETNFVFNGTPQRFPLASPASRFQVISPTAISYVCTPGAANGAGNGTGTLTRVSGYAIPAAQTCPRAGGAVLANYITSCSVVLTPGGAGQGNVLALQLSITRSGESMNLYHEVRVSNVP